MVGAAGEMVVGPQNAALLESDGHARPVLPALAAGEPPSPQSPAELLQTQKELDVLGLVGGVLSLDRAEQVSHSLQFQLCLGCWGTRSNIYREIMIEVWE